MSSFPRNDDDVFLWIRRIEDCVDDGDFESAMCALSALTTYFVVLDARCSSRAVRGRWPLDA